MIPPVEVFNYQELAEMTNTKVSLPLLSQPSWPLIRPVYRTLCGVPW